VLSDSFTVGSVDVALTAMLAPNGSLDTSAAVAPRVRIRNVGGLAATGYAFFTIDDGSDIPVWLDSALVASLGSGESLDIQFDTWPKPHAPQLYFTNSLIFFIGDQNPANDTLSSSFVVRAGAPPPDTNWVRLPDLPAGAKGKRVKDGGCIAHLAESELGHCRVQNANCRVQSESRRSAGSGRQPANATDAAGGYLYALKGNGRCEFYRFNIVGNAWETKESIPAVGSSGRKKAVKKGAAIATADGRQYAAKGNNTLEWWQYDPALSGTPTYPWSQMTDLPSAAKFIREGTGAATVQIGETAYVYFLRGSSGQEFLRYNTASRIWQAMAPAPLGMSGRAYKDGSGITVSDDGSTIFALKGSYNEFFSYDVGTNTWTSRAGLPLTGSSGKKKKAKSGAGIAYMSGNWGLYQGFWSPKSGTVPEFPGLDQTGGSVYVLKGNNTTEFWHYQADSDRWTQYPDMPLGGGKKVKGGGALTRANDKLYAFKGNNTLEFYSYAPASAVSSGQMAGSSAQTGDAQRAPAFSLSVSPTLLRTGATIHYSLPKAGNASLKLYDITGKLVAALADGYYSAGNYSLSFGGRRPAVSGVYVLRLEVDNATLTRKLIIE
jgi:hypothetical protein